MQLKDFTVHKLALTVSALFLVGSVAACGTSGTSDADKTTTTVSSTESTTTTTGSTTTTEGSGDGGSTDDYIAAIAETLATSDGSSGQIVMDATEAECVATVWVDIIGSDTFSEAGVTPTEVSENEFQFAEFELEEDQGNDMIDAIDGCGLDAVNMLRDVLNDGLDPAQQKCLAAEIDDETIRAVLVQTLITGEATEDVEQEFARVEKTCEL